MQEMKENFNSLQIVGEKYLTKEKTNKNIGIRFGALYLWTLFLLK